MKTKNVYILHTYSKSNGIGAPVGVFASKEAIINYITRDGQGHGRLTDEFDNCPNLMDYMSDKAVLRYIPIKVDNPEDDICTLLGREPEDDFYIMFNTVLYE